ncbi:MAG TPA: response regulator [Ramlibacter sp.]|nr:response regulator [Ramlibacter sp.]
MQKSDGDQRAPSPAGRGRKVLIVDDEEVFAENLQTHFQRCGWDARVACNGRLALIAADEFLPEVILLDYHLPDMNGFQVLDAIRAAKHCCGCVLMTGHPTDAVVADAQRHGVGRILCKPFPLAGLENQLLDTAAETSGKWAADPAAA